jgi:hypothetical protein
VRSLEKYLIFGFSSTDLRANKTTFSWNHFALLPKHIGYLWRSMVNTLYRLLLAKAGSFEHGKPPKKFEDEALEELLDCEPRQTLSELSATLGITNSAVFKLGIWTPHELFLL